MQHYFETLPLTMSAWFERSARFWILGAPDESLLLLSDYVCPPYWIRTVGRVCRLETQGLARLRQIREVEEVQRLDLPRFTAFRCFIGECIDDLGQPIPSLLAQAYGVPFILGALDEIVALVSDRVDVCLSACGCC